MEYLVHIGTGEASCIKTKTELLRSFSVYSSEDLASKLRLSYGELRRDRCEYCRALYSRGHNEEETVPCDMEEDIYNIMRLCSFPRSFILVHSIINEDIKCLELDKKLKNTTLVLRSFTDLFYIVNVIIQIYFEPKARAFRVMGKVLIDILTRLPIP